MITLHHLEHSQSFRIVWLLEELGLPYELKTYKRTPGMLAPDDYKNLSPMGTAPFITDGDLALSESNAIIDYILDKAGDTELRPAPSSTERTQYLFWFHAAQGSLMTVMSIDSTLASCLCKSPILHSTYTKVRLWKSASLLSGTASHQNVWVDGSTTRSNNIYCWKSLDDSRHYYYLSHGI
jgi:hypothetical protein